MSCDDVQRALVGGDTTPAVLEHLKSCVECQGFQRAARLRHVEPQLPTRVRRQTVVVRAALAVAVVLAGVVSFGVTRTQPAPVAVVEPVAAPRALETRLVAAAPTDEEREWHALASLTHELDAQLHRDVTTSDATYAPFGALPSWVAPQSTLFPTESATNLTSLEN